MVSLREDIERRRAAKQEVAMLNPLPVSLEFFLQVAQGPFSSLLKQTFYIPSINQKMLRPESSIYPAVWNVQLNQSTLLKQGNRL